MTGPRLLLVDEAGSSGRTTATLLSSLAGRLASLHFVTGADAVGSITSGFAALGRRVAGTAEGAALLAAIERGRAGANGDRVWSALSIGAWAGGLAPSPVLEQLRNDVALLLAGDLDANLELPFLPPDPPGPAPAPPPAGDAGPEVTFGHYLLGMWAFAREVVSAVEALAASTGAEPGAVLPGAGGPEGPRGPLLR